ncbi:UDP-N-acetylglucosamine--N-acetylmuramyl-(pentapeptide) pyrophosphoryl-undecaprenol N-acetylglucosamine transferase [Streptococcus parauberis]|uniref:UDP-N-acetylglucosamine--N-acetylmuramyl-(Pentapeptide) pyrophosphoryl-undecaprenol N-acetylglucosamine transferase n=1 Tax=Streptococcus parauberis TaxID=1348 RepID=A0AAE4L0E0_9STRE|nr:UDP-N-acetylglucosamine--N-acetylmuramyl-(pentapeptide) pyrophosphoryl-undecaprenol N-acetylglucosamine transferase [Streptococcus parauberis]MDT2731699.1 UDP-N-acetylglucosamine--N-acetylmuramyl-(pentapeptide) pyrophosphoryl-undecaprenol N-acetylglucosamine transferase [Streptococcus parauberis]
MAKRILFTGGGTVGHVTLNLILIPKFIDDGWEVHYIGDKNGIEYQEIKKSNLDVAFHGIMTGKLRRYFSWQNFLDVFKVGIGLLQSLAIIAKIRPKALFSKGGFVSVPPVVASKVLGVPVYVHESDLSMGLANKIALKFAKIMYTTFAQEHPLAKMKHVGAVTKVKPKIEENFPEMREIKSHFDQSLKTLLFVGGSAGAKVFNDFISKHPELMDKFNVINITGHSELNYLGKNCYRVEYVTDLYQPLMDMADVVVTRGGSNTLFELLAMQKLHVIVPLGKEASRGDQLENAAYFEKHHYARQIAEDQLTFETLESEINQLVKESDSYVQSMAMAKEIKSPDRFYELLITDMGWQTKG